MPSTSAVYSAAWRRLSRAWRRDFPRCEFCGGPAQVVDHRIPKRAGGTDEPSNLRSLCRRCHGRKTALYDGGYGNPVRPCDLAIGCFEAPLPDGRYHLPDDSLYVLEDFTRDCLRYWPTARVAVRELAKRFRQWCQANRIAGAERWTIPWFARWFRRTREECTRYVVPPDFKRLCSLPITTTRPRGARGRRDRRFVGVTLKRTTRARTHP